MLLLHDVRVPKNNHSLADVSFHAVSDDRAAVAVSLCGCLKKSVSNTRPNTTITTVTSTCLQLG